ncbi:MAG TPA: ATP-binding protein [Kiritimatiellia bacterium]|jgi:signal transduction histidine kinase
MASGNEHQDGKGQGGFLAAQPIRWKIIIVVLVVTVAVLLVLSVSFAWYCRSILHDSLMSEVGILAEVVGENSTAAVQFRNREDAASVLEALHAELSVVLACTFDAEGGLLAQYVRPGTQFDVPLELPSDSDEFLKEGDLHVYRPIELDGKRIGYVYLRSDTERVAAGLRTVIYATILLSLVAFLVAFLLAARMHRVITRPLGNLAHAMDEISASRRYDLRVTRTSSDEVGTLIDGFNSMLGQIQDRDENLQKTVQELNRSNAELENFAYIASHDLQEPLRAVSSFVQLLKRKYAGKLDADADEYISFAVSGSQRMQTLIQDLLAYSRVGKATKPFERVDCNAVMASVLADAAPVMKESGAEITCGKLPAVVGDETQLAQVFQNLVSNALKFRQEGPPRIHVDARRHNGAWQFSVQDNGIGIDAQYFDKIFVIFQRLHGRGTYQGTGIGLAICKKIVERHGGTIWVESEPGKGSTFKFTVPERKDLP